MQLRQSQLQSGKFTIAFVCSAVLVFIIALMIVNVLFSEEVTEIISGVLFIVLLVGVGPASLITNQYIPTVKTHLTIEIDETTMKAEFLAGRNKHLLYLSQIINASIKKSHKWRPPVLILRRRGHWVNIFKFPLDCSDETAEAVSSAINRMIIRKQQ